MRDLDDPYPYLAHLRSHAPVHRLGDSSFFVVSSWDLIAEVLARPEDFSSNLTATMIVHPDGSTTECPVADLGSPLHVLATADDPVHRDHRTMVMPALVARRVRALTPFIEAAAGDLWREGLRDGRIDWVQAVAQRLPMLVVTELLGLPSHDVDDLVRWAFASTMLLDGVITSDDLEVATAAVGELAGYLSAAYSAALANPGPDILGDLARLGAAGTLDDDTAVMILIQLVAAGAESTISLLGTSVWLLGRHRDIATRLRADNTLIAPFVEEALRLESPFRGHYRHVVHDTTLDDIALPAGSHLYLAWGGANRDPHRFEDPDTIVLDPAKRPSHMAFGKGIHLCVGAALARLETRTCIEFLLDAAGEFTLDDPTPQWTRSLLSRRLHALPLTVHPA
ncbi:cytochrome P450 [Williamsia limnetica]|uniref:Cytochrome P450 n=1 Tax=Williamsia limnetica TaxID=882452 RepID=A0A318RME8_WILLI|nr:cytochrome P450 [Williamsia limnetica]PYE17495.1 cytochrome P450 [Williamsia limnetica]